MHQPAVIWCPNCGAALEAPVKVHETSQYVDHKLKVIFAVQFVEHSCGKIEGA